MNLADLRLSYTRAGLLESDVLPDPVAQFAVWFEQARSAENPEPNAMALATVSAAGEPSCRMVLLKVFDESGFVWFTSRESRKAEELRANPKAAILFYWPELERQVRVHGLVESITDAEVAVYFASRPRGHQLGAWASHQSSVVDGREALEASLAEAETRFAETPISCPPYWGGYRLRPHLIEFWQGRANRLHDRLEYLRQPDGTWTIRRLAP